MPVAMGKDSLQEFLGQWKVHPLHTFRIGFHRTWIVRAKDQPFERIVYHEFGFAVIKEATPRRLHSRTERFQAPRPDRSVPFVRETESNYPKSWAGVVAGSSSPTPSGPSQRSKDGTVSASAASTTSAAGRTTRARLHHRRSP